jgi:predicted adenylyl cyclase CyaB
MYEVELKAILRDILPIREVIESYDLKSREELIYDSIYFDSNNELTSSHRELRLRSIKEIKSSKIKNLITYKDPPFDVFSRSKPEIEIEVDHLDEAISLLQKLGYESILRFQKQCTNYRLNHNGLDLLVTLAYVEELDQYFIEVESPTADENEFEYRFSIIKSFLSEIGVRDEDLTNEYYSEAILKNRSNE